MKHAKLWGSLLVLAAVMLRPEEAVSGAQRAMRLWYESVAPALFPFLVLMPVLTGAEACAVYERMFRGVMGPLFSLPGTAAPAIIIGMISGSPGGAMAVSRIAAQTGMKKSDAARIALAVAGVSPAYLILGVGYGLYGSVSLGMKLAAVQICIQIFLLFLLRAGGENAPVCADDSRGQAMPVITAVENVLGICGYMVFFSAVASVAASFVGDIPGRLLLAAADLPSGLALLDFRGGAILRCAAIGFGGLCIGVQNLDALKNVHVKAADYIAVRIIAASIFACASELLFETTADSVRPGEPLKTYAFSLCAALMIFIPCLIYFSKNIFLNKRNN